MKPYIRFTVGMLALLGAIGSIENSPPLAFLFMGVLLWCVRAGQRKKVQYVHIKRNVAQAATNSEDDARDIINTLKITDSGGAVK